MEGNQEETGKLGTTELLEMLKMISLFVSTFAFFSIEESKPRAMDLNRLVDGKEQMKLIDNLADNAIG